ncbi:hypothetical protein ALQ68_00494 [Pseudomonas savastanoi pv. glycinea]|nr:hypothetical protein ALQ68_00494 [Pseudomonas savastanoi pv. glycinea]
MSTSNKGVFILTNILASFVVGAAIVAYPSYWLGIATGSYTLLKLILVVFFGGIAYHYLHACYSWTYHKWGWFKEYYEN